MSFTSLTCPACGAAVKQYRNPLPTVDIIIELDNKIVLIKRKNPPHGWALPGGFVDYGESLEAAAIREAQEETNLTIHNLKLLGCYSDPARDERMHTITTVYVAQASGTPQAADDAAELALFLPEQLPAPLCFDHARILADYISFKAACP
ncbi:8-oxo-dGTP diphosphatase [Trichlorobacter thiogenes]|uniref:8-oxo-dGTP diphosphatase n=1 Tax=Trichlorobacter thiogenes TaxID=115783 RepID=A0A1T4QCE1_9BACT|nr:NUDIX hydrolase [Trichlorobacter thiogenes]SKA01463.1 8-oxo-dGTP diphosphatase [Trichlorobacter thiogenes]